MTKKPCSSLSYALFNWTHALLSPIGGYPGIHRLPDETILATTHASLDPQEKSSIVSVRFKMSEMDEMAAKPTSGTKK